jgi:hypothetical protein
MITRGTLPFSRRPKIEDKPMLKAIGTLMAMKQRKARLRIMPIVPLLVCNLTL